MHTLIIADAYPIMVETIINHLSNLTQIKIVGTCHSERELKLLLKKNTPDLFILDPEVIQQDCLSFCRQYLQRNKAVKILLFANISDVKQLQQYYKAGISGYLPKKANSRQLLKAIEQLSQGQLYIPDFFRNQLAEKSLGIHSKCSCRLTNREKEVLKLIIGEHTTKEIAKKLFISCSTAETHRLNIIAKLGVRNTAGVVREGIKQGLHV